MTTVDDIILLLETRLPRHVVIEHDLSTGDVVIDTHILWRAAQYRVTSHGWSTSEAAEQVLSALSQIEGDRYGLQP